MFLKKNKKKRPGCELLLLQPLLTNSHLEPNRLGFNWGQQVCQHCDSNLLVSCKQQTGRKSSTFSYLKEREGNREVRLKAIYLYLWWKRIDGQTEGRTD